jgi:tRNA-dihydrouridine synthase A
MTQVLQFLLVLLIVVTIGGLEFHVAPMQGYTDRHLRYLYRLLVPQATMWSEMLKPKDLLGASSDKRLKLLSRGQEERLGGDCVLQLGGDDADELVQVIQLARSFGYSQFDLNCGCPSIETNAHFGASLMKRAHDVAELVERMAAASFTPVSVKCRIGVHDTVGEITEDRYESLRSFVEIITASGAVRRVVVHARSAVLQGMSPSSNRQVPPLRYDHVLCLAQEFPHLDVTLNGGIASLVQVQSHMSSGLAGVMCGRWCLSSPFDLLQLRSMLV